MRGDVERQTLILSAGTPDQLIPQDHPIRLIKPMVDRAHREKAWEALEYGSWKEYVEQRLKISKSLSYDLITLGQVMNAFSDIIGEASPALDSVSNRQALRIKPHLQEALHEVEQAVAKMLLLYLKSCAVPICRDPGMSKPCGGTPLPHPPLPLGLASLCLSVIVSSRRFLANTCSNL
jgi:hypothetical protein